jgi:hypothetical protein
MKQEQLPPGRCLHGVETWYAPLVKQCFGGFAAEGPDHTYIILRMTYYVKDESHFLLYCPDLLFYEAMLDSRKHIHEALSLVQALVFLAAIMLSGCTAAPSRSQAISDFWTWFTANQLKYIEKGVPATESIELLTDHLKAIDPNLTWQFGPPDARGRRELAISADGIKDSFPAVREVVSAAPDLPKWHIIAFRPRIEKLSTIQCDGETINPSDVQFTVSKNDKKADIVLFIKGYKDTDAEKKIGFLLLDQALGEYDVETKIGIIDFSGPDNGSAKDVRPFKELPAAVDALKL